MSLIGTATLSLAGLPVYSKTTFVLQLWVSLEGLFGRQTKLSQQEPNPNDIRPLHVLTLTLKELKRIWREKNDYKFINNQFKSLRQDLTVSVPRGPLEVLLLC